ncbi:MAG: HlyD family secretion protein [Bdellovibrionaceae bacterium]|nr:HlyD family secretion protein [Pseudobdellovibrionaceae bacterium]
MEKKQKIFTALGALAVLGGGYFLYEHFTYATTDNAQIEAHSVMLAPKVSGFIQAVNVTEGQHVQKDDILVEIDGRDFENTLRQVKGELTSIEARKRDAEKNFKRLEDLVSKGAVSQQQFDTSTATFAEVRAKYEAISAQVAQAELNLANTKIRAPANGFIARKSAEVGQLAAPGVPLVGFVSSESRWITANFKETEVADIKIGAPVDISIDAISSGSFHGKVAAISSATGATFTLLPPDNATGNFTKVVQRVPVKIEFDSLTPEQIEMLRAGLSAFVKVRK